ncbi:hypothetical protein HDV05_008377 [Chytridiales sp. JEL 0842]|nr:hypothetical protein HDV05_008377 [Chytridiales sp. JEL 0842]
MIGADVEHHHDDDKSKQQLLAGVVVDASIAKIPFRGKVKQWELQLSSSDYYGRSVSWLKRQCADHEHVQEDCVVLFNIPDSANSESIILSSDFLTSIPDNIDELQILDPERVETLVPEAVWLANPFEKLKTLNSSKLRLLALIAQKHEELPTLQDLPPKYNDIRVSINYVKLVNDIDHLAISTLESPLPDNHASHTAKVFDLLKTQDVQTPTTPNLVEYQQSPVTPDLVSVTELSSSKLWDRNVEKLPLPPEYIQALESKTADYLESKLPYGHQLFTSKILQLQDMESKRASSPSSKLIGLPLVPTCVVHRDNEIKALKIHLETCGAVCVVGELGVGKTFLATQYAIKHQDEYDWVVFISCSTDQSFLDGFQDMLAATAVNDGRGVMDEGEVIKAGFGWLEEHGNYLLILDDAHERFDSIRSMFGGRELALGGRIIITSRNADVSDEASMALFGGAIGKKIPSLPIPLWTRLDTITYLKQRVPFLDKLLKKDGEQDHLNEICENYLGDYPLIVEQFATKLIESGRFTSLKIISQWLKASGWDQLLDSAAEGRLESFTDSFKHSLESLVSTQDVFGPVAVLLICILGTFASSPLPESVFQASCHLLVRKLPSPYCNVLFEDCLRTLHSSALLRTESDSKDIHVHGAFHQLAVNVGWTVLEERCSALLKESSLFSKDDLVDICWEASATLIPATIPTYDEYYAEPEVLDLYGTMTPHLLHLSRFENQAMAYVSCLERLGWRQYTNMKALNAKPALDRALELRILETGSRVSLASANVIECQGGVYLQLGDFKKGESLLNEAFETKLKICGTREAEPLISTYEKLVLLMKNKHCYDEAISVCQEALDVIRKVRGNLKSYEGQYIQMILGDMLSALHKGDGVLELEMLEEALETCRDLNDPHSATNILITIGNTHIRSQQYKRAIEIYQEALTSAVALYKSDKHHVCMSILYSMAVSYQELGAYDKSLGLYQEYLENLVDCYGTLINESIAQTIANIGQCYNHLGQYDIAIEKIRQARNLYIEMGLEGTFYISSTKVREARAQSGKGNMKLAVMLIEEAMAWFTGPSKESESYLDMLHLRGGFKRLLGDYEGAKEDIELCLTKRLAFYKTRESRDVADSLLELGCIWRDEGKLGEGFELIQEATEIMLRTMPNKTHIQIQNALFQLGVAHKKLGEFEQAKVQFTKCLEMLKGIFGAECKHPKAAVIQQELDSLVPVVDCEAGAGVSEADTAAGVVVDAEYEEPPSY